MSVSRDSKENQYYAQQNRILSQNSNPTNSTVETVSGTSSPAQNIGNNDTAGSIISEY